MLLPTDNYDKDYKKYYVKSVYFFTEREKEIQILSLNVLVKTSNFLFLSIRFFWLFLFVFITISFFFHNHMIGRFWSRYCTMNSVINLSIATMENVYPYSNKNKF